MSFKSCNDGHAIATIATVTWYTQIVPSVQTFKTVQKKILILIIPHPYIITMPKLYPIRLTRITSLQFFHLQKHHIQMKIDLRQVNAKGCDQFESI